MDLEWPEEDGDGGPAEEDPSPAPPVPEGPSVYEVRQECERLGFRPHFNPAGESVLTPAHLSAGSPEADAEACYGSDLDDLLGTARAMTAFDKRMFHRDLLDRMQDPPLSQVEVTERWASLEFVEATRRAAADLLERPGTDKEAAPEAELAGA